MPARPLVQVGDIVNAEFFDYHRVVSGELTGGRGDLHLRVTHLPDDADTRAGDWIALRGVELRPGEREGDEMPFVVHRRALPGYQPRQLPEVPGLVEWDGAQ
ncbi:hypothetical protein BDK92_5705 [Micromonospora pisi]|uniref:Uncharacterized protein n=1 Tax=Micromonospora pisi TaxID=589240 RepID=A0A495JSH3_9ACTN|nr:hypothetical protein [Micromonospora pisi]RKR91312.1 hypothetical protein BDK92_5705 [Micromonospora pisi]